MAKIDQKVLDAISKLQSALIEAKEKGNKRSYEATKKSLEGLKRKHGIKDRKAS